jgi:hypothetical protein
VLLILPSAAADSSTVGSWVEVHHGHRQIVPLLGSYSADQLLLRKNSVDSGETGRRQQASLKLVLHRRMAMPRKQHENNQMSFSWES